MYDWKGAALLQFRTGLLCIRLAGLWYRGSICQWTSISLQHLPITIDLGGKERAWSKQQTQTFSEIPRSHRAQFQQSRFSESLGSTPQETLARKSEPSCHGYDICIHRNLLHCWSAINLGLGGTKHRVKSPSLFISQDPIITEIPSLWLWDVVF